MVIEDKLLDIKKRASDIQAAMNSGDVSGDELTKMSREYARLNDILPLVDEYFQTKQGIDDANEMLHDEELREIANEQLEDLKHRRPDIEKRLQIALLPPKMIS